MYKIVVLGEGGMDIPLHPSSISTHCFPSSSFFQSFLCCRCHQAYFYFRLFLPPPPTSSSLLLLPPQIPFRFALSVPPPQVHLRESKCPPPAEKTKPNSKRVSFSSFFFFFFGFAFCDGCRRGQERVDDSVHAELLREGVRPHHRELLPQAGHHLRRGPHARTPSSPPPLFVFFLLFVFSLLNVRRSHCCALAWVRVVVV